MYSEPASHYFCEINPFKVIQDRLGRLAVNDPLHRNGGGAHLVKI